MARQRLSRGDLLLLAAILSAAGAAVAAYLTYEWDTAFTSAVCDISSYFSCSGVGQSPYASFYGVPTSLIGLGGFVILFVLAVLAFRGRSRIGPWSTDLWMVGFATLGALVGVGLTVIEIFVIQKVCLFCVAGFALDLGVLAIAVALWRRA